MQCSNSEAVLCAGFIQELCTPYSVLQLLARDVQGCLVENLQPRLSCKRSVSERLLLTGLGVVIAWKMKGKSGYTAVGTKLIYSNADTRA
jgi:hypothetical protein